MITLSGHVLYAGPLNHPVPGPTKFPICCSCHVPFVLRRTQAVLEPGASIVEWRFYQDCDCKPARYSILDETKDTSQGRQSMVGTAQLPELRWTVQVPSPPNSEAKPRRTAKKEKDVQDRQRRPKRSKD